MPATTAPAEDQGLPTALDLDATNAHYAACLSNIKAVKDAGGSKEELRTCAKELASAKQAL